MHTQKPENALTHRIAAKNIGQLVRVGRKRAGIFQSTIADCVCVPLQHVEKIERGQFRLSAAQWLNLCELLNLDFEMLNRGYIDHLTEVTLMDCKVIGDFQIPQRYAYNQGSSVRSMMPFLDFVHHSLGRERFLTYLRFKQLDPDFFLDYSHQLSVNFALDTMKDMICLGLLRPESIDLIAKKSSQANTHGILADSYEAAQSPLALLDQLIQNIAKYEVNCDYTYTDLNATHIDLAITPRPHFKEALRGDDLVGKIPCFYKQRYFINFVKLRSPAQLTIEEKECYHHGANRCVYRMAIGA